MGSKGVNGNPGAAGASGTIDLQNLTFDAFWTMVAAEPFAKEWAKYRHSVGEYFFRCYIPGSSERDGYVGMAVDEFNAALRLDPTLSESILRRQQIWNNMNPLGLPRDMDVIANFKEYISNLTNLTNLHVTFASIGSVFLLKSTELATFQDVFRSQRMQSQIRIESTMSEIEISVHEEKNLDTALKSVQTMMDTIAAQIEKAKEEMKRKPVSFMDKLKDVAELAAVVASVVAAVPTGGASLLAMAPHVITFTKTAFDNFDPLLKAVIDGEDTETLKKAKGQLEKVKDDRDKIQEASGKITDMVNFIDKIKAAKTPDNSKLVGLLQKAAELAYEYMLKQQDLQIAQMRTAGLKQRLASENELRAFHDQAIARTSIDENITREAGLKIIQSAFAQTDILLKFAFYAQRSIEIYLLVDQTQYVYYDAGRVHPDVEADCLPDPGSINALNTAYMESAKRLLDPTGMWKTWQDYFGQPLKDDIRRLPVFNDPADLAEFRTTYRLAFSFDVETELPSQRFFTKIQTIGIALVGAKGDGRMISCEIEHGGLYSQRKRDGQIVQVVQKARDDIVQAPVTYLTDSGFQLAASPPLENTGSSPLWGMGLGGLYTITISTDEVAEHHVQLEGLQEIEVWIGYQFME
jgi:hypothetical protein